MKAVRSNCSRFLLPIFAAVLISACVSGVSVNDPLEIPADIAGLVHAGETGTPEEYALLDKLGANWLVATFYWGRIEPAENQLNFDSYDKYVDTAKAAEKKVFGVLGYDVPWIHEDNKRRNYIPPGKIDFFLNYVRQTAVHFRGRVDAWCIWNEPNFHFWKGNKQEFFEITRRAADVLREADPDAVILGGAFNRGVFGLPKAYIRGLFESGAMEKADAVAFHPYELNPARTVKLYGNFRTLVAPYGFADRIWITEAGYPTGGLYPTKVPEKRFPEYVVKTFVNLAAEGVPKIFWYELFDSLNRKKSNSEDFFGLVRSREDYTSKGAEAFRLCSTYLAGTVYRPDLPRRENIPRSVKAFYFEKPGGAGGTLVFWKDGSRTQIKLQISGGDNNGSVRLTVHDPVSGKAAGTDGTVLKAGSVPVFVTWEGGGVPVFE